MIVPIIITIVNILVCCILFYNIGKQSTPDEIPDKAPELTVQEIIKYIEKYGANRSYDGMYYESKTKKFTLSIRIQLDYISIFIEDKYGVCYYQKIDKKEDYDLLVNYLHNLITIKEAKTLTEFRKDL